MTREGSGPGDPPPTVPEGTFARDFLRHAVTRDRVVAALESLTGKQLRFGPYSATGLASVSAGGALGTPEVEVSDPDRPSFKVTVPAALDVTVRLGVQSRLRAEVRIELMLTPRAAAPLLLVIDIAAVRAEDVRIEVSGDGLGAPLSGLLTSIANELRAQIARQITAVLDGDGVRRARTYDIAARIDGRRDAPTPDVWDWIEDEEFGRRFVAHAVSETRVRKAFAGYAGQAVEIGPLKAGPRKLATVTATGTIAEPAVAGTAGSFAVTVPLGLDLVVGLGGDNRYHADVEISLVVVARTAAAVHLVLDFAEVTPEAVRVALDSDGRRAGLVGRLGRVEDQIRHQVARTVNARVAKASARVVDIGARIDQAGRSRPRPRPSPSPKP